MKKLILIIAFLISTFAISQQTTTINNKLKLKNTPNLSTTDSLVTKDSNQILRSTSFTDFKTQLSLDAFMTDLINDTSPQLGGNLDLNNFDITGNGNINNTGNLTTSGTLQSLNATITNDLTTSNNVKFINYPNARIDATAVNFLHTDINGNLLSSPVTDIITTKTSELINDGEDGINPFLTSFTETDPIFTASQANNITAQNITDLSNLSGINSGDQVIPASGVDFDPVGTDNSDNNAVNTNYANDYRAANFVAGTDYIVGGVGNTNYIPKFTASGVLGNSIIYDDGTNVGIGTESVQGKFEVFSQSGIYFSRDADPIGQNIKITADVISNRIESKGSKPFKIINTTVNNDLILGVNNSDILIIDGSFGNVLIDTTDNGVDKFQVNGSGYFNGSVTATLVKTTNYQSSITTNYTILDTDNGKTLWFDSASAITITIDDTLSDQFQCDFINRGAGLVTFAAGTATLVSYEGLNLSQGGVAALFKYFAINEYWLKGEML